VSAPAVIIRLELEASPHIYLDTIHSGEEARLRDWIERHPDYVALIRRAQQIAEQERAA
jgi:hypothetical protein